MRGGLWEQQAAPCPICAGPCQTDHRPFGAPKLPIERPYLVTENVWRDDRLVAAVNETIPHARAVELGLIEDTPPPAPPGPRGARKGRRARRPDENRARTPGEDR